MAKRGDMILGAAALGVGLLLASRRAGGDSGNGDTVQTCDEQIAAAQQYAMNQSSCAAITTDVSCPHGDVQYTVADGCELAYLTSRGWQDLGSSPDDNVDEPDPEFRAYEFRVLSASATPVTYTLHLGPQPTLVTSGIEERYWAGDSGDTASQRQDGSWIVQGETGSADGTVWGDTYRWTTLDHEMYGILGWEASQGSDAYTLEVNGTQINPGDLPVLNTTA